MSRRSDRGTLRDAAPYRRKIETLVGHGATTTAIAAATGLTRPAVDYIRRAETRSLRAFAATALDQVTLADCIAHTEPSGMCPAVGTIRRLEALLAIGWTHDEIHARIGLASRRIMRDQVTQVTRRTHDNVSALFDELCMTLGPSEHNRARARRFGWLPPLAWDDLDDPDELPQGCAA